jgi:hypothetical protein
MNGLEVSFELTLKGNSKGNVRRGIGPFFAADVAPAANWDKTVNKCS